MDADFLLIHKMKNGDEEAIEVFVKKYYSTIRNYCRLHTYTDCDAEDITQAMGQEISVRGSENIGKILLLSFKDSEEEMIESVLAALKTGRNIYCDEKNINPLKIHYGDIVIFLATRELFRKQKKIDLSFTEFEILHLLMRNPGRVFSKEQIYDIIWNEPYSGDYNVVMRHICNIREKIEDDPGHPVYIQTVRGVGYRFNGNLGSE